MGPVDYWLMAREYSIWNATVAALQFWTADLEAHMLSSTIEQVYNAFFYSTSTHLLHQQSDEILLSHFVITLNATFESKLALEDKGYESGSENFNIPNPLRWTSKIHHISSAENASFDPDPVAPCSTGTKESHCRLVHRHLTFSSSKEDDDDTSTDDIPSPNSTPPVQYCTDTLQQPSSKYILIMCVTLEEEEEENYLLKKKKKKKRTSKQSHAMMNIGIWKKSLTDIYAFMNIHYHMDCVHIHVHIWINRHHHTKIPWT